MPLSLCCGGVPKTVRCRGTNRVEFRARDQQVGRPKRLATTTTQLLTVLLKASADRSTVTFCLARVSRYDRSGRQLGYGVGDFMDQLPAG